MKKKHLKTKIYILLTMILLYASCNGQTETKLPNNNDRLQKNITNGQSKIPKPKDSNSRAIIDFGIQDKFGNFWFGSNGDGLYRYDGKAFFRYSTKEGLNSDIIYSIIEDKAGNIWVGTKKGLNRLDGDKFVSIPIVLNYNALLFSNNTNRNIPSAENAVWCMMQDKYGIIWFGTDDGVFCYNGTEFTGFLNNQNVINKDSLNLKGIFSILEVKNGNIWFAECAGEGVSCFDGKTLTNIIPYKEIGRTDRIIEDKQNNLWFATAFKGVGKYDGKTYTQNIFKDQHLNGSYNILEDKNENIWFDTQDGLGFYDGKTLHVLTEKEGTVVKDFIPVLLDKAGNLWFSSKGMKLYKYDGKTFANYSEE